MKAKISIITLAVQDLEKSMIFYKDGLGFPMEDFTEGTDHIIFGMEGDLSLVLYLRSQLEELNGLNSAERSNEFILSCTAGSREEVDSVLDTAAAFGGSILSEQPKEYDWGYSGYFKDPDGHIWEVVYFG